MKTKYYLFKTEKQLTRIGIFIIDEYFSYFYNSEVNFQQHGNTENWSVEQVEDMMFNYSDFVREIGRFLSSRAHYRYYVTKKSEIAGALGVSYMKNWIRELKSS